MRRALLVAVAACGGADLGPNPDGGGGDGGPSCDVYVTFDPPAAIAGPTERIRAIANVVDAPGVLSYTWQVRRAGFDLAYEPAQLDGSAVDFAADVAGPVDVVVAVDAPGLACPTGQGTINIHAPGSQTSQVRLRVWPPAGVAAPPSERLVLVQGGAAYSLGVISIDPGIVATGQLPVQAYLRFIPVGSRDAYVEAFASTTGAFSARVLNQPHDVLVIPLVGGYAPRLVIGWTPGAALALDAGTAITGVVRGPSGATIAGAKVQLRIDGVPSSLATTDSSGAFSLRAVVAAGATVVVEATPPPATGLPRLVASSTGFDLGQPLQIAYAGALVLRDLGGATIRRGGAAQGAAQITVVGRLATAGTITAGAQVAAAGEVRISAIANAQGVVPATLAPAAPLAAVIALAPADFAVAPIDLTAAVPSTIDAPPMLAIATQLRDATLTPLPGATFEAVPAGALAMAGADPVRVATASGGAVAASLAAGGRYELRLTDPAGRAAPLVVGELDASAVAAAYTLPAALGLSGSLVLSGNPSPVGFAAVQILCTDCTGTLRSRPLAEGASTAGGAFTVPVLDPGTM